MIQIGYDAGTRKGHLKCDDEGVLSIIRNKFSIENPRYTYAPKDKKKSIPKRIYVIDSTGRFPVGLYEDIQSYILREQIDDIKVDEDFRNITFPTLGIEFLDDSFNLNHRDYQEEIILAATRRGRGVILSATGSGKSFMTASLIQQFYNYRKGSFKCLVIVPGLHLAHQLIADFDSAGVKFSYARWDFEEDGIPDTDVVVCNSELLLRRCESNKWIFDVDMLIVDEAHKTKAGNKLSKVVTKIKTHRKFAFTGTLPEEQYDIWKIKGIYGPVIVEKTSKELRDAGWLSDVHVLQLKLNYNEHPEYKPSHALDTKTENYILELDYIYTNSRRNEVIDNLLTKLEGNTLILVNHIRHGEELLRVLKHSTRDVVFIEGKVEVDARKDVVDRMENGNNVICIAMAAIFSTGVNIKKLHNIIFASGGKAFIRIVQGIGRGLRLHDTKKKLMIIDLWDQLHYGTEQGLKRDEIYKQQHIRASIREITI